MAAIYESRGLSPALSDAVATELMEKDPLGSHLRDELGISDHTRAAPLQAAVVSASSFALGSIGPIVAAAVAPQSWRVLLIATSALLLLLLSGSLAGSAGGASKRRSALRVLAGGVLAMAVTALIGRVVGTVV